ncbi:hypothetical protein ABPG72_003871 [Tetrahymena utriculariae]
MTTCSQYCTSCSSPTVCLACQSGFYLSNSNTCINNCFASSNCPCLNQPYACGQSGVNAAICQSGQFIDHNGQSYPCPPICNLLSPGLTCTICNSGKLYIVNGTCISSCPATFVLTNSNQVCECRPNSTLSTNTCPCNTGFIDLGGICESCPPNCNQCSSQTACRTCQLGYYLFVDQTCKFPCPTTFIPNNSNQSCACRSNSTLSNLTCPCNTGFIDVGGVCQTCPQYCNNCSSQTVCTTCQSGYYLFFDGTCEQMCPATFVVSNVSCVCRPNSTLLNNTCPCNIGFIDVGGVCQTCPQYCNNCSSQTVCTTCQSGYYLFIDGTCVQMCPATFVVSNVSCVCRPNSTLQNNTCPCNIGFIDVGGVCQTCPQYCNNCSSQTVCTTCQSGYYLFFDGTCVQMCPATFVVSNVSCVCRPNSTLLNNTCPCNIGFIDVGGVCQTCPLYCNNCSSQTVCTTCQSGYYLFIDGTCVQMCPATFLVSNVSCVCRPNSTLQNNTCPCNTGYLDVGGNCLQCGANCNQCSTQTNCTICSSGYYLFVDGTCVSQCPSTFIIDSTNTKCICRSNSSLQSNTKTCPCNVQYLDIQGICQQCQSNCDQCSSQTICSVCSSGFYLKIDNTCVSQCPTTFVKDSTNTKCVCRPNSTLQNDICNCIPSGFVDLNDVCQPCPSQCDKCSSQTVCLTCISGYYLTINATCSSPCPSSFIQDSSKTKCVCPISSNLINDICIPCDSNCLTCTPANNKQCNSCFDGYILKDSTCLQQFQSYNSTVFTNQKIEQIQQQTQTASQISSVGSIGLSAAQNLMSSSSFGVSQSGLTSQKLSYLILVKTNFPAHIFLQINSLKGQLPSQSFKQLNLFLLFIDKSDIQYYDAKFESVGLAYYTLVTCGQALVIFLICLFSFILFYILNVRIENQKVKSKSIKIYEIIFCSFIVQFFQLTMTIFIIGINVQVKQYVNHFNLSKLLIEIPLLIMMFGISVGTFYAFYIYLNKVSLQTQQFSNIVKQKLQNETKEELKLTRNFILIVLLFESFIIPTYFIQLSQHWLAVCIISIAVSFSQLMIVACYMPFYSKLTNAYFIFQYFSWVFLYVLYLLLNIYCTKPDLDNYASQIDTISYIFIITVQVILVEQPVYMILALLVQLITIIRQKLLQRKEQKEIENLNSNISLLLKNGGGLSEIQKKMITYYDIEMKHSEIFEKVLKINYWERKNTRKQTNIQQYNNLFF